MSNLFDELEQTLCWADKYRPRTLDEVLLPKDIMIRARNIAQSSYTIPLLFFGLPGTGKTSTARLLRPDAHWYINAGDTKIAKLLKDAEAYCTSVCLFGNSKLLVIDEVDCLSKADQEAIRALMDKHSRNTMFVFTTNNPEKLLKALQSRLCPVDFSFDKGDSDLINRLFERAKYVLMQEGALVDDAIIRSIVKQAAPDMRSILNRLQFDFGTLSTSS